MIVLPQLFMLFVIAGFGVLLRKRGVMTDPVVRGVSDIVTMVANPLLLITVTQHAYDSATLAGFLHIFWMGALVMGLTLVLVYAACRRQDDRMRPILALLASMPNAGFMGLPIIRAVFGDLGALYLAAYVVAFSLIFFTVGIALVDRREFALRKLVNPTVVAAIVGTALFLARVTLPELITAPMSALGSLTTPLAMLLLGARMAGLRPRALADPRNALVALVKLIAMPMMSLLLARAFSLGPEVTGTLVLLSAMPSAVMVQLAAEQYGRDALFAARQVSLTSVLSIATIPLIASLLGV